MEREFAFPPSRIRKLASDGISAVIVTVTRMPGASDQAGNRPESAERLLGEVEILERLSL